MTVLETIEKLLRHRAEPDTINLIMAHAPKELEVHANVEVKQTVDLIASWMFDEVTVDEFKEEMLDIWVHTSAEIVMNDLN